MSLYTITFSTIKKRSIFNAGVFVEEVVEFKKQTMTGLPLRVAMQYDLQPDFQITAEVPTPDRRAKPPRTPSQINWNGGGAGTRTLKDDTPRLPKKVAAAPINRKLDAAATGDLGAAISEGV